MSKQTITLAEPIQAYIDGRIADGRNSSLSEYVSYLIAQDISRQEDETIALRGLLDAAEESGLSERSLEEILEYARSSDRKSASKV